MPKHNVLKKVILKIVSVVIIAGGVVRLFASKNTFQSFLIGKLWTSHEYFIYIYRVLGAFVLFVGITLFIIAQEPERYVKILTVWSIGFLMIGIVMFFAGFFLKLTFIHYLPDFVFCFIVAAFLYIFRK